MMSTTKVIADLFGKRMELEDKLKDTTGNITNERSGGDKVSPPRCMIPQKNSYTRFLSQ